MYPYLKVSDFLFEFVSLTNVICPKYPAKENAEWFHPFIFLGGGFKYFFIFTPIWGRFLF